MNIEKMLDIINVKISGLHTLTFDYIDKRVFGRTVLNGWLYRNDYPEGTRIELKEFYGDKWEEFEADVVEYLFDIIITEKYRTFKNLII